jgi:hypothetical protein
MGNCSIIRVRRDKAMSVVGATIVLASGFVRPRIGISIRQSTPKKQHLDDDNKGKTVERQRFEVLTRHLVC